ncbi:MAG: YigZ family protein [Melioribacteraceae bacterium]|nr:YigZ family protein [Melioribacteraceae bacterium]
MSEIQKFTTIKYHNEFKFKEKGSLFIAHSIPVETIGQTDSELNGVRKKFYDATHNCYAFQLRDGNFKYSDDGEPNGTAGIRIYNAIKHFELFDLMVVVTRYFGGTKLGVGPLGKAYYNAAMEVLSSAEKVDRELYHKIEIKFDFNMTSNVHHFINIYDVKNIVNKFSEGPVLECLIKPIYISELTNSLREISAGKITLKTLIDDIFI